jgi:tetratricopeptide (TPR) repeat protein
LAYVYKDEGNIGAAQEEAVESLRLWREANDRYGEASARQILGLLAEKRGELEVARDQLEHSLELRRRLEDVGGEAAALRVLGRVAMLRSDSTDALNNLIRALELTQRVEDLESEALTWVILADLAGSQSTLKASAMVRATATVLLRSVDTAEASVLREVAYQELDAMTRLDPTIGDSETLLASADRSYRTDRGWPSIQSAFGPLDNLVRTQGTTPDP